MEHYYRVGDQSSVGRAFAGKVSKVDSLTFSEAPTHGRVSAIVIRRIGTRV